MKKTQRLPDRAEDIKSFIVMDVLEKAQGMEAQGRDIIHLEIGEPDFDTPEKVKETAARALRENDTHYTHSLGKLELREAIAGYYDKKYGVKISPEQIIVTSGTSPGMLLVLSVLLENGDDIIIPDPYYACYPNFVRFLGGIPSFAPVREEDGFKYRAEEVMARVGARTRAVMVNSPGNPTGAVYTGQEMKALADTGQLLVSDEIYNGLIYEGEEHSVLEFTERAFVVNGFSKLYAMTGWRLGYIIAPPEYVRAIQKIQQNLFICASSFAQTAAVTALNECGAEVAEMVKTYNERRLYLLGRLKEMGVSTRVDPTGAFYALANVRRFTTDSYSFAYEILNQIGVAVTPGIDFGPNCEGYLRLSYANSLDNIKEGLNRLDGFFKSRPEVGGKA